MGKGNDPNCSEANHTMDVVEFVSLGEVALGVDDDTQSSAPVAEDDNLIRPHEEAQALLEALLVNNSEGLYDLREGMPPELVAYLDELRRFADEHPLGVTEDPPEALEEQKLSRALAQALAVEMRARGQDQVEVHSALREWLHGRGLRGIGKGTLTRWVNQAGLDWDRRTEGLIPIRLSGSSEAGVNRAWSNLSAWEAYKKAEEEEDSEGKEVEDSNAEVSTTDGDLEDRTPRKGDKSKMPGTKAKAALAQAEQEVLNEFLWEGGGMYTVREGRLPDYMRGENGGINYQGEEGVFVPELLHQTLPRLWIEHRMIEGEEPGAHTAQVLVYDGLKEHEAPGGDYLGKEVRKNSRIDFRWYRYGTNEILMGIECKAIADLYKARQLVSTGQDFPESLKSLDKSLKQMNSMLNIRRRDAKEVRKKKVPKGSFTETTFELLDTKAADSIRALASDPKNWVLREDGKRELVGTVKDGVFAGDTFTVIEDDGDYDLTGVHHLSHVLANFKGPSVSYLQMEKQQRAEEIMAREEAAPVLARV